VGFQGAGRRAVPSAISGQDRPPPFVHGDGWRVLRLFRELPPDRAFRRLTWFELVRRTSPGAYRAADQRALKGGPCASVRDNGGRLNKVGKCPAGFKVKN